MIEPKSVEVSKGIYWVGSGMQEGGLHCNPYLIVDGEEAVLIDPGSVLDFEYIYANVCSIVPLEKIKYVILHHQDPDFCSAVPLFEKKGANFTIVTHWRTQTIIKYYGIQSEYYYISRNGFRLKLASGRILAFIQTPYLHFAGAIVTYDYETKILFSSDLFGAFSGNKWGLYADSDYLERMKTFHEHYMPSNDILRAAMEIFLGMDIHIIAPQHGSIIQENVREHILVLRDLECGKFLKPIHKNLVKSGGYRVVCSLIIKRLISIFNRDEVMELLDDPKITLNDEMQITDYSYTGIVLWNLLFERIYTKKGIQWLLIVEPYVKTLAEEYEIPMPEVFFLNIRRYEEESLKLNKENTMLKEINTRLEGGLAEARNKLTLCPLTGVYNFEFFKSYLTSEIESILEEGSEQNPCLIVISMDNLGQIRYSYGDKEVDESLKNLVYILRDLKEASDQLFRLQGAQFACYLNHSSKENAIRFAEKLRNEVAGSKKFIETTTVSIGVAAFDEIRRLNMDPLEEAFYEAATNRLNSAKRNGMNMVFSSYLQDAEWNEEGEILITDTDEVNLDVLKTFLESLGYKTVTARDGEEALRMVEGRHINLILTEIMLPKMDGFLLRERLLTGSATKNIPYILVSHLKDDNSVQRATSLEIEHYFKKPYMMSELLGVVKIKLKGDA